MCLKSPVLRCSFRDDGDDCDASACDEPRAVRDDDAFSYFHRCCCHPSCDGGPETSG